MKKDFVPADFEIPLTHSHEHFRIEVLEPSVVEIDYDAVMSSKENLRTIFAENDDWPADDMSLEKNMSDLITHEKEFKAREAFAFTVLTTDKTKCIGCLYIEPSNRDGVDAEVYYWLRDDSLELMSEFEITIKSWLAKEWPFNSIAYPGREISWEEWGKRSHDHI
ncbi:hypothetical protein [Pseudemcibacter aquimaris]|uniref:hypothetical protein n=1 Tax=Pseudemcibacter aquimaris TaxID=2857064 RepID=UPI0020110D1F|nr:hypothetical protein [Pseudemcibacter aquimaris]MCC3859603.1 hypothetical protein [Pseudemcibacter aquimaris]WDU59999.1 hypothetical protein KW060_06980 [Pseudemcibacter aquimaris]